MNLLIKSCLDLKQVKLIIACAMIVIAPAGFAAGVSNVSPETFAQYGKENAFFEAVVSCDDGSDGHVIQRKTDGDAWCPKGAADLCSTDKDTAAKNACSDAYAGEAKKASEQAKREQQRKAEQARARAEQAKQQEAAQQRAQAKARQEAADKQNAAQLAAESKVREKIAVQEQRNQIDQEKLELNREELALEKRAFEIEAILETLE